MIVRLFFEGGAFFMSLVYLMWILVFILGIRFLILYRANKNPQKMKRANDSILFFGSLGFLIGMYGQMTGLIAAFDAIQSSTPGIIGPQHIAGGLKVTFIAPSVGMMLFILSVVLWFVFRNLKKYPSQLRSLDLNKKD